MLKLTNAQKQEEIKAQRKALDFNWFSELQEDVKKRYEYADTIYQQVTETLYTVNPIPEIFDVQTGELGKKIYVKRHFGAQVYERTYGEFKRISTFKGESFTMTTSPKAIHMKVPVEHLKAGVITTSELVDMATTAILHHKVQLAWRTMKDAMPTSNTTWTTNSSGDLTQTILDAELREFKDKYTVKMMLGRESYLFPITLFTGYDNSTGYPESVKEELHAKGMVSKYRNVPIMTIKEMKNEVNNVVAADAANLWIISDNAKDWNRWTEVTPVQLSQKVEPEDGNFHLIWDWEDGAAIWKPRYMRRVYNGNDATYA